MAVQLAQAYNVPIISADSRQFYQELNIGVARPSEQELAAAKHYFIADRSVSKPLNAGSYELEAIPLIEKLFETYDKLIVVGGSGLYLQAITEGFDDLPASTDEVKARVQAELDEKGVQGLIQTLEKLDPEYLAKADLNNHRRLSRALEVCYTSGKPFSSLWGLKKASRNFASQFCVVNPPREVLYNRINARVDIMLEQGLIKEVEGLGDYRTLQALQTVGYREVFAYLDGECSFELMADKIKQNTRNFAKRQVTWFRAVENAIWVGPDDVDVLLNKLNND